MPARMFETDLLAMLDAEAARLAREADRGLPSDPVPTCPEWTVRDLVTHLGGVHRWAAAVDADAHFVAPADDDDLHPWFVERSSTLIHALRAAPDDLQTFVFLKNAPPAK